MVSSAGSGSDCAAMALASSAETKMAVPGLNHLLCSRLSAERIVPGTLAVGAFTSPRKKLDGRASTSCTRGLSIWASTCSCVAINDVLSAGWKLVAATEGTAWSCGSPASAHALAPPFRIDSSDSPRYFRVQYTRAAAPKSVWSAPVDTTTACTFLSMPSLRIRSASLSVGGNWPGLSAGPRHCAYGAETAPGMWLAE